ncbi:MAG TPA: glycosyltransferase family 4 protein [Vicinamibacterales bacterium]|nr:glycosyltransferase family 4 protein [Vicinamibacterales bacterium]
MTRTLHIDTAETWRGGQNQVLQLVTGLSELGHTAVLVGHDNGELKRRAQEGLRFIGFSPRSEFDVHAGWQLAKIFADVQPEVVHAHDPMAIALAAMALQMKSGLARRPLFVAARRVDFHLKQHAFSKWKHGKIDVFIAASRAIASILEADGIPADRIAVVHDGVNVGLVDKQPVVDAHGTFWLPHGAPIVGNVAALAPHKGQRHLVAAAARVVREEPDTRFLILGEGELRDALTRQIKDLGLERHVLLGGFRGDVLGLMKSFDLFAMSSVTEGLGSSVLEAMACGRAVVGTRAGGIPESVVDGETGLLVPPQDDAAMAAAIVTLLREPSQRAAFGAAGRDRVIKEFSTEAMTLNTLRTYERFKVRDGK